MQVILIICSARAFFYADAVDRPFGVTRNEPDVATAKTFHDFASTAVVRFYYNFYTFRETADWCPASSYTSHDFLRGRRKNGRPQFTEQSYSNFQIELVGNCRGRCPEAPEPALQAKREENPARRHNFQQLVLIRRLR